MEKVFNVLVIDLQSLLAYTSTHLCINLHIYVSIYTSVYQSTHLCINLYIYVSIYTFMYPSIHLCISLHELTQLISVYLYSFQPLPLVTLFKPASLYLRVRIFAYFQTVVRSSGDHNAPQSGQILNSCFYFSTVFLKYIFANSIAVGQRKLPYEPFNTTQHPVASGVI